MGRACSGIEGHRVVWIIARNRQPWHRFKWLRQIQPQVPSNGLRSNSNLPGKSLPYMWILDDFTCPVELAALIRRVDYFRARHGSGAIRRSKITLRGTPVRDWTAK